MTTATPSWGVINPGKHPDTLTGRRGLFIRARDRGRMGIDMAQMAAEQVADIDDFVLAEIGIDPSVLKDLAFELNILATLDVFGLTGLSDEGRECGLELAKRAIDFLDAARSQFPEIPRGVFVSIGAAYRSALRLEAELDHQFALRHLQSSSFHFGKASGLIRTTDRIPEEIKRVARSQISALGAHATHKENRRNKAKVFNWLNENFHPKRMKLKDATEAIADGKLVPTQYDTVRKWVTEWRRLNFPIEKPASAGKR